MKLAVIGAGLPRTGTMSTKLALEILYPEGPCYHMITFVLNGKSSDADHWHRAISGKVTKDEWIKFFDKGGYRCAVDYPAAFFYKELLEAYPEAKVILSVRDPIVWHESCYATIFNEHKQESTPWIYHLTGLAKRYGVARRLGNQLVPGFEMTMKEASESGPAASKAYFEKWVQEVKNYVPEKQLLVFDVRDGWKPLCDFLELPIPDCPFPKANDRASLKNKINVMNYVGWSASFGVLGILGGLMFYLLRS